MSAETTAVRKAPLRGDGVLTISLRVNLFLMTTEEREIIYRLLDQCKQLPFAGAADAIAEKGEP